MVYHQEHANTTRLTDLLLTTSIMSSILIIFFSLLQGELSKVILYKVQDFTPGVLRFKRRIIQEEEWHSGLSSRTY